MKKIEILFIAVFYFVLFLWFLSSVIDDVRFETKSYEVGPFLTPIEIWCSKRGVEYLITQNSISVHVDSSGNPINCQRAL